MIALVGHEYLIHDPFISHNLSGKLERMGANPTYDVASARGSYRGRAGALPRYLLELREGAPGTASHFLGRRDIDGVMLVMGFACGPDSIIGEIINREVRGPASPPLTTLVLDEHTGQAGVSTRVEAFVDLIRRARKKS